MLNNKILSVLDTSVASYREAYPFPHTILDNFLDPWMLRQAIPEIENYQHWRQDESEWVEEFQVLKQYAPDVVADPNDVEILANGVLERTGLVLDATKNIVVYADSLGCSAVAFGLETATA